MFKKIILIAMATALTGATFTACGKKTDDVADGSAVAQAGNAPTIDCSAVTEESLIASVKGATATEDESIAIFEALQCCKIDDKLERNSKECEVTRAIEALDKDKKKLVRTTKVADKLVKHPSNIVRAYPLERYATFWGKKAENVDAMAKAYADEKDPYVLKSIAQYAASSANDSQELGNLFKSMLKNDNDIVRNKAVGALGSPHAVKVEGVVDALTPMINDSNIDVAKRACEGIGRLHDDKAVEPIVAALNDEAKSDIHGSCLKGLQWLWLDFPSHESTSEAAYKASLDYLNKTPRSEKVPAWIVVGAFNSISASKINAWKDKATYYKPADLVAAYSAIVKDTATDWRARQAALKGIAVHGTKADVEALRASIEADPKKTVLQSTFDKALTDAAK
mgnify:CR=1 FL=1